jgi:UDP-2,3-diacylglucosamine pyrophosphatase LpxH
VHQRPALRAERHVALRRLADDTLIVFLSDSHIGGDGGHDIFESPDDLAALFDEIAGHAGPVELVLAGDFFDFLRIAEVEEDTNRASATIARPEYRELFETLRRFAAGEGRRVVYLPGNHDAEAWWNPEIQADLLREGLAHEFDLSYAAVFDANPELVVYCEHGNQFDPPNTIRDYTDGLDTPLGHHIVTDFASRIPDRGTAATLHLRDVDRVFPLATIPQWVAGRLFYRFVALTVRWLLVPLLIAFAAYETIAYLLGAGDRLVGELLGEIAYDVAVLLVGFGLFMLFARRMANRAIRSAAPAENEASGGDRPADPTAALIRSRLESGSPAPLEGEVDGQLGVFVSGHTHAPALSELVGPDGGRITLVNSGCWLRQVQPVAAHLRMPAVYTSRFVQSHVRVYRSADGLEVELWEHPRASGQRPSFAERLAIAGRTPAEPTERTPRVRARTSIAWPG